MQELDSCHSLTDSSIDREAISIRQLQSAVKTTLEVGRLCSLLLDHHLPTVISSLPPSETRRRLLSTDGLTLSSMVGQSAELCPPLISAVMRLTSGGEDTGGATEATSNRLQAECPSLFTRDDAQVAKATEALIASKLVTSAGERRRLVEQAVATLRRSIQRQDIVAVCDLLLQVHHFTGVVELVLARVEKDDPNGRALELYRARSSGEESSVAQGEVEAMLRRRNEAYRCITEAMGLLRVVETHGSQLGMGDGGSRRQSGRRQGAAGTSSVSAVSLQAAGGAVPLGQLC